MWSLAPERIIIRTTMTEDNILTRLSWLLLRAEKSVIVPSAEAEKRLTRVRVFVHVLLLEWASMVRKETGLRDAIAL